MSDYIQASSYIHAGKDWTFNASNHLSNVKILQPDANEAFMHMVFSIPRDMMSSNASTFADWQSNEEGSHKSQAYKATLCWFLEFVHEIGKSNPPKPSKKAEMAQWREIAKENGDGVVVFFEIVKAEDQNIVGERIHVFVNRGTPDLGFIIRGMLDRAVKKSNEKKVNFKAWEYHQRHVKSKEQYILNIANIYLNDTTSSEFIYDSADLLNNSKIRSYHANPLEVFSLNNFKIEGAQDSQNTKTNYFGSRLGSAGGKLDFIFPDSKLVVKRYWHQLEPSYLWNKYLPSHQYKWVDLPEITVCETQNNSNLFEVYIKPCPASCTIEKFMEEEGLTTNIPNIYSGLSTDQLDRLKIRAKDRFIVHEKLKHPKYFDLKMDGVAWVEGIILYDCTLQLRHASESMEYTERLKNKYQNQHSISAFDMIEMETAYRMEFTEDRRKVQELMVGKFKKLCICGDADISDAGKAIARWKIHTRPELAEKFKSFEFEIIDRTLSPFANMQYWFMQALDSYMCVASAHPELFKLHYAIYDAYRQHGQNQLHWNMIYTGESATSKSFVFEGKNMMCIPGTVTEITYQTTRADAVDGDQNDHITVFNEAPPGLFQASGGGEEAQKALSMMKEKLTSNRVRTKTYELDEESGERRNRIAISSQIGCYVGATNDNPALAEEAVASRFHWGEFEKTVLKNKSIADYQRKYFEMQAKPELKRKYDEFIYYCQDQQMKVFYIWKFIFCGIIRDIDLEAANLVMTTVGGELRKKNVRLAPRTIERYRILCRVMTITNALDIVFNFKGGKQNGNTFELIQLLDVEPLLYCTEEIAICALNMVAVEVPQLSLSRDKTLCALWKLFRFNIKYRKEKDALGINEVTDYNYIRFTGGVHQLCRKIQHSIPLNVGKPSIHNIHSVLTQLSQESIRAHKYISRDNHDERARSDPNIKCVMTDTFPVHVQEAFGVNGNLKKPDSDVVGFIIGNHVHDMHISLFDNLRLGLDGKILQNSILNTVHDYTKKRRIITGVPEKRKGVVMNPQLLDILHLKDVKCRPPEIRNSSQENSGVKTMMGLSNDILGNHHSVKMNVGTDTWAWHKRTIEYLGMKPEEAIEYHPEEIEYDIKKSTIQLTFPNDLKQSNQTQERVQIYAYQNMGIQVDELRQARKRRRTETGMTMMEL